MTQEGKINILGVFDVIHCSQFPAILQEMQLVMRFEADITERGEQKEVQVRLINGQGAQILELSGRLTVGEAKPGDLLFFTQILKFQNVVFPDAGDFQFDVWIDGSLKSSTPLKVVALPSEHKG
jgi:hypothetical protein